MLISLRLLTTLFTATLLIVAPAIAAKQAPAAQNGFEIVKPEAGYVIEPRNPATYNRGDTVEFKLLVQGSDMFKGSVNVTLVQAGQMKKKNIVTIGESIPMSGKKLDVPITILLSKFEAKTGNYKLKVVMTDDQGQKDVITRKVQVKVPKGAASKPQSPQANNGDPKQSEDLAEDKPKSGQEPTPEEPTPEEPAAEEQVPTEKRMKRSLTAKGSRKRCLRCSRR